MLLLSLLAIASSSIITSTGTIGRQTAMRLADINPTHKQRRKYGQTGDTSGHVEDVADGDIVGLQDDRQIFRGDNAPEVGGTSIQDGIGVDIRSTLGQVMDQGKVEDRTGDGERYGHAERLDEGDDRQTDGDLRGPKCGLNGEDRLDR